MNPTTALKSRKVAIATMDAVRIHEYGGPEVLMYEEARVPRPQRGELLVRVRAAAVNPVDWKVREGHLKDWLKHKLPLIPGWDFSGVVEATGPGVARLGKGDEVHGYADLTRDGAYAEYIVVRASAVALKPKSLDHVHAAAIPVGALTAWQALFELAGLRADQKVLIHAAAGGVGGFAVQLAKWKGSYVIGTASERNLQYVRKLGADEVVDYQAQPFEQVVRDVDIVLDTIGGETQARSWRTLKKGGVLVSTVAPPAVEEAAKFGACGSLVSVQPNGEQLSQIGGLADSGKLNVLVELVLPLTEARQAQELSQAGHTRGKIVLRVL